MFSDTYDVGPIRPPSEAGSLLIRVSRNCPWNKCEFCHVYKETKFEKKSLDEIKKDIDAAAQLYGSGVSSISTAFLQDANAILMKTSELIEVIIYLKSRFPAVSRITT
ncbi:MAG TPA: radical SAM protein, partial [bacterium]|nr:radical SAM protein [bacterium]